MDLSVYHTTQSCGDHPIALREEDIAEVVATRQWCYCERGGSNPCGSYCDGQGAAVYGLKAGGYVVVTEDSDTSGHG